MQRKSSEKDKDHQESTVPSEIQVDLITTLDSVKIGMTLVTVHLVTVVSISMTGPITKQGGSKRGIFNVPKSKDGEGSVTHNLLLSKILNKLSKPLKSIRLTKLVINAKSNSEDQSRLSVDISSVQHVQPL